MMGMYLSRPETKTSAADPVSVSESEGTNNSTKVGKADVASSDFSLARSRRHWNYTSVMRACKQWQLLKRLRDQHVKEAGSR